MRSKRITTILDARSQVPCGSAGIPSSGLPAARRRKRITQGLNTRRMKMFRGLSIAETRLRPRPRRSRAPGNSRPLLLAPLTCLSVGFDISYPLACRSVRQRNRPLSPLLANASFVADSRRPRNTIIQLAPPSPSSAQLGDEIFLSQMH